MADTSNLSNYLKDIADAIREKKGTEEQIPAANFDTEIRNIESSIDISDATATTNDVIAPNIFYNNEGKQIGAIQPEYVDSDFVFTSSSVSISTTLKDYRPDIGLAVSLQNGITIYSIDSNNTLSQIANYSSGWPSEYGSSYTLNDAKFGTEPIYEDDDHCIYNLFVAMNHYYNMQYSQGVYCIRFDTKTNTMYEGDLFSSTLTYTKHTAGSASGFYPHGYTVFTLPISATNALLLQSTPGKANSTGDMRTEPILFKTSEKGYSTVPAYQAMTSGNGAADCTISGNIYCTYTSNSKLGIYVFSNNYTECTPLYSNTLTYYPVLLDDKYILDDKLYNAQGNVIKEYDSLFNSATNYKFYINGYILEMDTTTGNAYRYTYDPSTFEINFDIVLSNIGVTSITLGNTNLSSIPRHIQNGLIVYNANVTKYIIYKSESSVQKLVSLNRNNEKFVLLSNASLINSNDLLQGISAYGNSGMIIGTMPNNGELIYDVSEEDQIIPEGYTTGGTIAASPITEVDYDSCLDLAYAILGQERPLYTPIEYIETTGTQYVDTGIKCSDKIKYQVKFSAANLSGGSFFGAVNKNNEKDAFRFFNAAAANSAWYLDYGSGEGYNRITGGTGKVNTVYEFEIGNRYIKDLSTGSNIISKSTVSFTEKSYNFNISNLNEKLKIYYLKLYVNDELVYDFMPVKDSEEIVCLYDKVTEQYFYNSGTGDFIAGPEL